MRIVAHLFFTRKNTFSRENMRLGLHLFLALLTTKSSKMAKIRKFANFRQIFKRASALKSAQLHENTKHKYAQKWSLRVTF